MALASKIACFFLLLSGLLRAEGGQNITEIRVTGSQSLSEKQILAVIRSSESEELVPAVVNEDIKRIWRMGRFTDVKVNIEPSGPGVKLVFDVQERALIKEVRFFGNKEVGDGTLKDKVTLKENEKLDQDKLAASVKAIETLYKDKNYYAI